MHDLRVIAERWDDVRNERRFNEKCGQQRRELLLLVRCEHYEMPVFPDFIIARNTGKKGYLEEVLDGVIKDTKGELAQTTRLIWKRLCIV